MDIGSDSYRGNFPKIFAQGTKPRMEIDDNSRGPAGNFHPVDVVATGRFGGSKEMKVGRDSNPIKEVGSRGKRGY